MDQSKLPLEEKWAKRKRRRRIRSLERESAAMKRKFILKGLMREMKSKESKGMAKVATKRLMPAHCSGVKIFHHFTEA